MVVGSDAFLYCALGGLLRPGGRRLADELKISQSNNRGEGRGGEEGETFRRRPSTKSGSIIPRNMHNWVLLSCYDVSVESLRMGPVGA